MNRAVYGEIVTFDDGTQAVVESMDPEQLGIMLFDGAETVGVGTMVTRSGKRAGIPVGDAFLGRVISPLGEPIDGKGPIEAVGYNPIEKQAPGILERQSVDTPLHTGILAIDSMFPIGRGQRELIIGRPPDRQDLHRHGCHPEPEKHWCAVHLCGHRPEGFFHCPRGRRSAEARSAMSYTHHRGGYCFGFRSPAVHRTLCRYRTGRVFHDQGKSVLIVYDDLSKHAVAYRAISLLLRRSPGREAYPGDVFYLHSRLLERSCRMRDDLGGGSITALPIVETQAGDVSAYIPTNVISITDGQIFLESALFNAGNRPAVNVGLSVSRVGGAAQTKAMKKANSNLRIELAQYKDMESFAQFSSDLDAETRRQLEHGKALTEMLKQPLYQPKSDAEQVVVLTLASHGMLDDLPLADQRTKPMPLCASSTRMCPVRWIRSPSTGKMEPEMVDTILNAWKALREGRAMASSKLLKERIESIQDTMKITNAMYLISSSKLRKARQNYQNVLPYFTRMRDTISRVVPHLPDEPEHPFFHERRSGNPKRAYIVLTADKGMAGAYNQNLLKFLREHADQNDRFYVIGQVGYRALFRKDPRLVEDFHYGATAPTLQRARDITVDAIDDFKSGKLDEIYIVYTKIQNALTSEPVMERLLPLDRAHLTPAPKGLGDPRGEVEMFPDAWTVFEQTAPIYMHGMIFGAMTESFCAEQSARMTAMDSATKSAKDMIHDLELEYNRSRQGSITQEITEIIGGAAAVQNHE